MSEQLPELKAGSMCPVAELECLHKGDARKRARSAEDTHGFFHQALPHKSCGWWHVYLREQSGGTRTQRASRRRQHRELREKLFPTASCAAADPLSVDSPTSTPSGSSTPEP